MTAAPAASRAGPARRSPLALPPLGEQPGALPCLPFLFAEGSCSVQSQPIDWRKPRALGAKSSLPPQKERGMDTIHRILIIDDNAVNRRMAQVMFQKLGWEAETVDSGERALLSLAAHCPDLILLDISMPGMNGLEVCQRIRADLALAGVRVIAYTAHALPEEQQRFLAGGFDDVLVKPTSFQAVQELIMAQTPCP